MKLDTPIYKAIALDIAQRIVNEEFAAGAKLSGRSLLAGKYNVSPETIRKAIVLLKEENVVAVSQGKEVLVKSLENAYKFIEYYKYTQSVDSLQQDMEKLLGQKKELDCQVEKVLVEIITYSDRLRNLSPYNPVEVQVSRKSHAINRTISDIRLWQNTGATIVAIRRGDEIMISPGPNAVVQGDDRLVVVGDADVLKRTQKFIQ